MTTHDKIIELLNEIIGDPKALEEVGLVKWGEETKSTLNSFVLKTLKTQREEIRDEIATEFVRLFKPKIENYGVLCDAISEYSKFLRTYSSDKNDA